MSGNKIKFCLFCIKTSQPVIYIIYFYKFVLPTFFEKRIVSPPKMTSPVGERIRYLPKQVGRSLSRSHVSPKTSKCLSLSEKGLLPPQVFCLYGVYRGGPPIRKVCHYGLLSIYTCLPPLKAPGAATITGKLRRINIGIRINCKSN